MQLRDRLRGGRMLAVLALSAGMALPLSAQRSVPAAGQAARTELLERTYRSVAAPRAERDADLKRILIHEIYGHAVPYLIAGHVRGQCRTPRIRGREAARSTARTSCAPSSGSASDAATSSAASPSTTT